MPIQKLCSLLGLIGILLFASPFALAQTEESAADRTEVRLLLELPDAYHTPNGADIAPDGSIILTVPNLNNSKLVDAGVIAERVPAVMLKIDAENNLSSWYSFGPEDRNPETGRGVQPMDAAFGPDGHLYITDMRNSRVLRINVENGKAIDTDAVAQGIRMPNSLTWKEEVLFVTASRLARTDEAQEADGSPKLISGVYAFSLEELRTGPVVLKSYDEGSEDKHLLTTFRTSNAYGVGADGLTIASDGNLYTAIFEDGAIYKTTLDADNRAVETVLHADGEPMLSADGIVFNPSDNRIYVADIFANAVRIVDLEGHISTLYENDDTTGEAGALEAPAGLVIRGSQLIVVNTDMVWPVFKNTAPDRPFNISVIELN